MAINREAMKKLPIQGYLDYRGIEYTVEHNRLRLVDHDSLIVNLDRNVFIWNSRQKSGDLGDFIAAYEDVTPKEAWVKWAEYGRHYNGQDSETKQKYTERQKSMYQFDWNRWRTSKATTNSEQYLVNERGLDANFVSGLAKSGYIYQGMARQDSKTGEWQRPALLFPWYDASGKVVGLDLQGTTTDFEKFGKRGTEKKIAAGSNDQYGYNFRFGNGADKLIVFESPIDALSYAQMNFKQLQSENATLISIRTNHNKVLYELDRMNRENGRLPGQLIMATDNDLAGYEVADRFDQLRFDGIEPIRQVPVEGKDWNDQLKARKSGITSMTMEESHSRLTALAAFADKQHVERENKATPADEHEVASASGASKRVNTAPNRTEGREARRTQTRQNNERIIKDAMERVANYKNDPAEMQRYLDFVANGQNYSVRNTMLIYGQHQDATIVMGYKQFAERGIQVNKGETGMKIFGAPTKLKTIVTSDGERVYWRDATAEQRRAASTGQLELREIKHYPIETVFDVKQTNAKLEDLPKLLPNRPVNLSTEQSPIKLEQVYKTLKEYAENQQHVRVIDDHPDSIQFLSTQKRITSNGVAKGAMIMDKKNPDNTMIVLRNDLPVTDRIATLAHEMGHVSLHQNTSPETHPTPIKELQAELTSYVILKNIGVEPGDISEKYMSDWTNNLKKVADYNDKDNTLLAEVTKASTAITDYLSDKLSDGESINYKERVDTKRSQQAVQAAEQQAMQDQASELQGRKR